MGVDLVVVFAGGSVQAGRIRTLLEADGLTVFLRDENMGLMEPWAVAGASVGAVKVVVPRPEADRALRLMRAAGVGPGG